MSTQTNSATISRVLILSCSQSKRPQSGATGPAWAVYDGPAWRTFRAWADRHPISHATGNVEVLALSAEYGLIHADRPIAWNYDRKLCPQRAEELASDAGSRNTADLYLGPQRGAIDVLAFGGPLYCDLLDRLIPDDLLYRRAGDEGRGIGDQLGELKSWLTGGR